jgi:nardilysin
MQEIVVKSFSSIHRGNECENPQPTKALTEIFKPEFFNKIHYIKPKTSKKAFCLSFALPSMMPNYKCDPTEYVKKIFSNNGEGGISSYLREKHLVTSLAMYLEINTFISNSSFCLARIIGEMTDQGVDKLDEILGKDMENC